MRSVDVAVIGGSLAGAACVLELRRRGIDAVAFDRNSFPRTKVCGGFLSPGAVESLDQLGVLDEVRLNGALEVDHAAIRAGSAEVHLEFKRPGLGISRYSLDAILARRSQVECQAVQAVRNSDDDGFVIETSAGDVVCRSLVDAAGKLSRWSRRNGVEEFGVQFMEPGERGSVLDFWFFEDGYGGAVTVEGGQSNFCFLIGKKELTRYTGKPGCLVTGPLAYDRVAGDYIAIGDAAGMVDPFCGEGMHHALDTGVIAAECIASGFKRRRTYNEIRQDYALEYRKRWAGKRALAEVMRAALHRPRVFRLGLQLNPQWFLDRLWS